MNLQILVAMHSRFNTQLILSANNRLAIAKNHQKPFVDKCFHRCKTYIITFKFSEIISATRSWYFLRHKIKCLISNTVQKVSALNTKRILHVLSVAVDVFFWKYDRKFKSLDLIILNTCIVIVINLFHFYSSFK